MTHIVIFTGAIYPAPSDTASYWQDNPPTAVIAADSGVESALQYSEYFGDMFAPNIVVGDMDSIKSTSLIPDNCRVIQCDCHKDLSDTEVALQEASRIKGDDVAHITLVGGDGGRLDHLLAIYDTFSHACHADVWLLKEQKAVYMPANSTAVISELDAGGIVSVARTAGCAAGGTFKTTGLEWGGEVFRHSGMPSLSNWRTGAGDAASVTCYGCDALLITEHKARLKVETVNQEADNGRDALQKRLDFSAEIDKMTHILRRTLLVDGSRRENDAEHSWHIAMMALVFAPYMAERVDTEHAVSLCIAHDLVEIYAGDTFAYDKEGYQTKAARETAAADKLFAMLPAQDACGIRALWEEFEACQTRAARLANCMDRLQPFWHNVLTEGHTWAGGVTTSDVEARMAIVKECMPDVYTWVSEKIAEAVTKKQLIASSV